MILDKTVLYSQYDASPLIRKLSIDLESSYDPCEGRDKQSKQQMYSCAYIVDLILS